MTTYQCGRLVREGGVSKTAHMDNVLTDKRGVLSQTVVSVLAYYDEVRLETLGRPATQ